MCQPEPATILFGSPVIDAESFSSRSNVLQSAYGSKSSDGLLGDADGLGDALPLGESDAAGLLVSAAGELVSEAGVLVSAAGLLASEAGVLSSAAGVLASAAGVLSSTAGLLDDVSGEPPSANAAGADSRARGRWRPSRRPWP